MTPSVLQAVATTNRRGAEVFAVELQRTLTVLGIEIRTVALVEGAEGARIDVPVLGTRRLGILTLRRLRAAIAGHGVVVGHGSTTLPAIALAGVGTGVPFVYRSIGDPRYWATGAATRWKVSNLLRRATAVVALTDGAADVLASSYRIDHRKIHVIPKGVSADRFPPADHKLRARLRAELSIDASVAVIAYAGALGPEKNVALAIRAASLIPHAVLLVAGDGPDRSGLERLAGEMAPGRVRFLGSVPDVAEVLGAADALVLSSDTEGLPGVLMEAGFTAIPAVTTDVGWVREIVLDGVTGFVVPRSDARAMAAALQQALDRRQCLGAAARAHCMKHFEIGVVSRQWAQLLASM